MDGILLFNKPILWTSHDAVDYARRRLGQRSVGHAGTLDPLATGLLVLLVGSATKRSNELSGLDKDYAGTIRLGVTTETQDMEGRIVSESPVDSVLESRVREVFGALTGPLEQAPPAYSAIKKDGRKLYEWARKGVAVAPEPRKVTVARFELLGYDEPEARFELTCSKGTYVRSLAEETGRRLGCGAALSSLVRTRIGPYSLADALDSAQLAALPADAVRARLA